MAQPITVVFSPAELLTSTGSYASDFMLSPPSLSDGDLLRSLHLLAGDLSVIVGTPAPFLRASFASVSRRSQLLAAAFDDLLPCTSGVLPRSAFLCLLEVHLVLQRFKAVLVDCSTRSRTLLLLQSDEMDAELRGLHHDLATLLDLLPDVELGLADDTMDLFDLASRQCRRCSSSARAAPELKKSVLSLIVEIEREIVPGRERLKEIMEEVGITDQASCTDEIESVEQEIGERASEKWAASMTAFVGILRFAKCVLFHTTTPGPSEPMGHDDDDDHVNRDPPPDLRCPISLDLMGDPVITANGQTYDRKSIDRWFGSGKSTCPRTGQLLGNLDLVPNKCLKNLISKWCRENRVAMELCESSKRELGQAVASNKAALGVARMTASFLVNKLSVCLSPEAASRVVHEIRLLCMSGSHNRALVGDAGAVPMLVPLLYSEDAELQLHAVSALLNLSILEANKSRIMDAIQAVIHIMGSGTTWRAKEIATEAVLSLASVHTYRRWLGRNASVVEKLVHLTRTGPVSTKKDALAALLSLAGEMENVPNLLDAGVAEAALSAISDEETASALLAALAKRGGAEEIINIEGAVASLVEQMGRGTEWARESATAALVQLCQRQGAQAVPQVMAVPGVDGAIWELMRNGTDRARRKAASLARICRRWATDCDGGAESSVELPAMMAS